MVKFSSDYQPPTEKRIKVICKRGHPLLDGEPNVRTRRDGRRICRACESDRRAERYQSAVASEQPVPKFTIEDMWYDEYRYAATSLADLQKFVNAQHAMLAKAKAAPETATVPYSGGRLTRAFIIDNLEIEIPKLEAHITRRAVEALQEEKQ